eukprot:GHVT01073940.1.p1 GENE.GHVT01073940.1~~GHVT01073940.1.p1  ORF type:complete len:189 (+),score=39.20 GHVT01073940.1:209-775(+)
MKEVIVTANAIALRQTFLSGRRPCPASRLEEDWRLHSSRVLPKRATAARPSSAAVAASSGGEETASAAVGGEGTCGARGESVCGVWGESACGAGGPTVPLSRRAWGLWRGCWRLSRRFNGVELGHWDATTKQPNIPTAATAVAARRRVTGRDAWDPRRLAEALQGSRPDGAGGLLWGRPLRKRRPSHF